MYPFRDLFIFGGFAYSGANYAKVKDGANGTPNTVVVPNLVQPSTSYACIHWRNRPSSVRSSQRRDKASDTNGSLT